MAAIKGYYDTPCCYQGLLGPSGGGIIHTQQQHMQGPSISYSRVFAGVLVIYVVWLAAAVADIPVASSCLITPTCIGY